MNISYKNGLNIKPKLDIGVNNISIEYNDKYFDSNDLKIINEKINSETNYEIGFLRNDFSMLFPELMLLKYICNMPDNNYEEGDISKDQINLYNDGKVITTISEYNKSPMFFYLYELFYKIDFGLTLEKNILCVTQKYKIREKFFEIEDLELCMKEIRKKTKIIVRDKIKYKYIKDITETKNMGEDMDKNDIVILTPEIYSCDNNYYKRNDSTKYLINLLCASVKGLNSNGSIILHTYLPRNDAIIKFLYGLSMYFEEFILFNPECKNKISDTVFIIFKNLKNNIDNITLDKIHSMTEKIFNDDRTIINIFDMLIPNEFINKIYDCNMRTDKDIRETLETIHNLYTIFKSIEDDKKYDTLYKRTREQINIAKEWCIKYDIPIKKFYQNEEKEPVLINKYEEYIKYFPNKPNVNKKELMMTDIGLYSITPYWEANDMVKIIRENINGDIKTMSITEPNGGMGGNTLAFAEAFKTVNTVEYSPLHCKVLKHNINLYKYNNVNVYCSDYTEIMRELKQDVIFMDPPWGGPAYKYVKKLNLNIGKYTVEDILNRISTKLAVIKGPFNYDIEYFKQKVKTKSLKVIKIRNYIIIIAKF